MDRVIIKDTLNLYLPRDLARLGTKIGARLCGYCGCPLAAHMTYINNYGVATWVTCRTCSRPCIAWKHEPLGGPTETFLGHGQS